MLFRSKTFSMLTAGVCFVLMLSGCASAGESSGKQTPNEDSSAKSHAAAPTDQESAEKRVPPYELNIGDCFKHPGKTDVVAEFVVVPCEQGHAFEVYGRYTVDGNAAEYDDNLASEGTAACRSLFNGYVGVPYGESSIDIYTLYADQKAWNAGFHGALCAVFDPDVYTSNGTTGTLKGVNR